MKVLLVSFAFPPSNVIGAVRLGKLARYLDRRGHEVRVLTSDLVEDRSLPLEISRDRVCYTEYSERQHWLERAVRLRRVRAAAPVGDGPADISSRADAPAKRFRQTIRRHYLGLTQIPDARADWIETAIPAGKRLIEECMPEIIFASAPPNTGLLVASRLASTYNIPWIADFRDLWVDNPYYGGPGWRKPVDAMLERRIVRDAAGLVTVSPVWAEQLRRRHRKAVVVVYNGYAAEDFPPLPAQPDPRGILTIRYMGSIYPGFRDPSALFCAIAMLPDSLKGRVKVEFFSDAEEVVLQAAVAHRVERAVMVKPRVPYRRALELQMEADVLLLLQSSDRRDKGNLPAKLFEYLYARRPILFIGYPHGVAAELVNERRAGLVTNHPAEICDQLQKWLEDKQAGRLRRLDSSVSHGLSRDDQNAKLEEFFKEILQNRARTGFSFTGTPKGGP